MRNNQFFFLFFLFFFYNKDINIFRNVVIKVDLHCLIKAAEFLSVIVVPKWESLKYQDQALSALVQSLQVIRRIMLNDFLNFFQL